MLSMNMNSLLALSVLAFSAVDAHMIMAQPFPYGNPSSSPLAADGSDFPCKNADGTGAKVTDMAVGAPQVLAFNGSAVHGGGSCQISLTTDSPAKKGSKWQVIHSIEGGCPAKDASGNNKEVANTDPTKVADKDQYSFKIPDGIKAGAYTLAWTWHNKIGNREMYMNCAAIKVSGGASKRDQPTNATISIPELTERDTSFPDLFVANVPTSDCVTTEGGAVKYPNPGSSKESFGSGPLMPPTGPKCGGGAAASSSGSSTAGGSSGAGGAASGAAPAAASGAGSSGAGAAPSSPSGAVDVESSPSAGADASSPATSGSAPTQQQNSSSGSSANSPSAAAPAAQAPPAAPAAQGAAAPAGSTSCTSPGSVICSPDSKQIGTCDQNLKAVMIPVPAGTICKAGQIAWPQSKRSRIYAKNGAIRRRWNL